VPEPPAAPALAPIVHLADRTPRPVRDGADSPLLTRVPVDAGRRLTLPPAVLGALDVRPGQQVR
jgi:hypothetical protein